MQYNSFFYYRSARNAHLVCPRWHLDDTRLAVHERLPMQRATPSFEDAPIAAESAEIMVWAGSVVRDENDGGVPLCQDVKVEGMVL